MITTIQFLFALAIVTIVAIGFIIYVSHKKYQQGFNNAKEKFNVIPDIIYENKNLIHKGISPLDYIQIIEKEHQYENELFSVIPEFGIHIKYNPDDKTPLNRNFKIEAFTGYSNPIKQNIIITPNNISDGYHTFDELYQYRLMYNAGLVNMIAYTKSRYHDFHNPLDKITVYKSKKHNDDQKCFDGNWFIVVIETPWGQISNHYELKDWNKFNCKVIRKAHKYDGHTPQDCLERLNKLYSYLIEKVNKF